LKAGKPTVGRIIFNTYRLTDDKVLTNRLFASITATALHEILHVLGFDRSLYGTVLDSTTGLPYSYSIVTPVVLNSNRTGGANFLLKTPAVAAWALDYYGCVNVTGMPLEN